VYPATFEYFAPTDLDEALSVLERYGDEAKVLAGGQSLIPLMKLRFAAPRAVVDINRCGRLDRLAVRNGGLRIGALVRHRDCERSDLLGGRYRTLGDAAPQISDPIVRNLGTVCGSLRARGSTGRLGLGAARDRRRGRRAGLPRRAHDPSRGLLPGAVHDGSRAGRVDHRGESARSGRPRERDVPQARAQGRRLRHGRRGRARVARQRHEGVTYYFCNPGCRERFEADPSRYVENVAR